MVRVDLHLHSTYSDGKLTPEELVSFCYSKGLRTIALSDHDSTEGIQEGRRAACARDIDLIPAVELSASHKGLEIHLLGYFIDIEMNPAKSTNLHFDLIAILNGSKTLVVCAEE